MIAVACVLVIGALIVAGQTLSRYHLGLLTQVLIFGIFAMSLDLLVGYTGLQSLGHAAYFGITSYTIAIISKRLSDNVALDMAAGLAAAVLTSAVFGLLALRTTGAYFLMATMALAQVLWGIAYRWRSLTGGDDGMPGISRPDLGISWLSLWDTTTFFYATLAIAVIVLIVLNVIVRSPFGYALQGVRESESRMRALGYDTWRYKYAAFVLAGFFAGIAGLIYVYFNSFVNPLELSVVFSAEALLMVILGGPGTLFGPLLGAGAIVFLRNIVSGITDRWLLILGAVYVLVVLFAPRGIVGEIKDRLNRRTRAATAR
ncbi:MAG TPA: branched-chain amino acid ABC transporter permease [Chloroflexota bacterium]|nr:branched-chain amino acid ABC transporter permease [Chloroflexota bacterium]